MQAVLIIAFEHTLEYAELVDEFAQYVEHVIFVLHEYRQPHSGRAFCEADCGVETSGCEVEDSIFFEFFFEDGEGEGEGADV